METVSQFYMPANTAASSIWTQDKYTGWTPNQQTKSNNFCMVGECPEVFMYRTIAVADNHKIHAYVLPINEDGKYMIQYRTGFKVHNPKCTRKWIQNSFLTISVFLKKNYMLIQYDKWNFLVLDSLTIRGSSQNDGRTKCVIRVHFICHTKCYVTDHFYHICYNKYETSLSYVVGYWLSWIYNKWVSWTSNLKTN